MSHSDLTAFDVRALKKIAGGKGARLGGDGSASAGPLRVPAVVVDKLKARDLVEEAGGRLRATDAGKARLHRHRAGRKRNGNTRTGDGQAGYRSQHSLHRKQMRRIDGRRREVETNQGETPLGWLARRRDRTGKPLISRRQFRAGERLRGDFTMAGLGPRLTRSYDSPPISGKAARDFRLPDPTERQIAAKERYHAAIAAVGPGLSDALVQVCCMLDGLEEAEKALGWPTRSAKVVLGIALDRLADYYGM